jgi:hypothetical protein
VRLGSILTAISLLFLVAVCPAAGHEQRSLPLAKNVVETETD